MAPKGNKRERGGFHIENPSLLTIVYSADTAANACTLCKKPKKAYHNRCSVKCGTTGDTSYWSRKNRPRQNRPR